MSETRSSKDAGTALIARVRVAARQEQFLDVVSADEARARFEEHLDLTPLSGETVPLAAALTRVLANGTIAPVDAPPFDRSNVDGFALRAADTLGAGQAAPKILRLNAEVIACGDVPALEVLPGTSPQAITSAFRRSIFGAACPAPSVSAARSANPSTLERSKGGASTGAIVPFASTRVSAAASGTVSPLSGVRSRCSSKRARASSADTTSRNCSCRAATRTRAISAVPASLLLRVSLIGFCSRPRP